jgi:NDP-sugar pyrophosphorylase family protein
MKIVIPMAGRGSRFQAVADQNPEYQKPKPLINVKGKPMVRWAVESLPFVDLPGRSVKTRFTVKPSDLIFICLQQHEEMYQITEKLKETFSADIQVVLIQEVTRGAVETVLAAKPFIAPDQDMIISDSDHFFKGDALYEAILNKEAGVEGIIPVFRPPDEEAKWSYTLFDESKTAVAVAEKDPELAAKGAYANIGAYYFSKGATFIKEAEEMVNSNEMYGPSGKQEFFVAPLYQRLISKDMKIKAAIVPQVWGLGTPKDLEYFLANYQE